MADKKASTEYNVLLETKEGDWQLIAVKVQASSGSAAKRLALAESHPEGGTVVAVPTRSWEPEDLKPKLSFG